MQTALAKQHSSAEPRLPVILGVFLLGIVLAALTSCGFSGSPTATQASAVLRGTVHGGQEPVSGAKVQLYAAGTSGIGSAALPLLQDPVTSDSDGNFVVPATYVCPSASSQLYVVARGGNPGLPSGADNPSIALMTMLGGCGTLPAATQISINEVTTVGSIWPLASYMTSATDIGSAAGDTAFAAAVATVNEFVSIAQGISPGISTADSYFAQNAKLYSLADVLDKCVNSAAGQAGDGSPCGVLFSMAASSGGAASKDTIAAAMRIAQNPYNEVSGIYGLTHVPAAFQPALTAAPPDWTLQLSHPVATPALSLATGSYAGNQTVTMADATTGAKIYYTIDGSTPTSASSPYAGPISVNVTTTVQAIAMEGISQSAVAASTLTIAPATIAQVPAKLAFLQEPANAVTGAAIAPAVRVVVQDANGNTVPSATNLVRVALAGAYGLAGTLEMAARNGVATFSNLAESTTGSYTLAASSPGLASAFSTPFTITAPSVASVAAKLAFLQQPSNTVAGATMAPAVRVALEDAGGNVVTSADNPVTLALTGSTGLTGTLTITPVNGVATFSNLAVSTAGAGYALAATSPGLSIANSTNFNINGADNAKTYYLSSTGSDTNNGISAATAWLTPNHPGLNCGDIILAAPGNYNAMTITTTPTCSTHDAVWVRCVNFDTCKINQPVYSQGGIDVQASYWAFLGWEVTATTGPWAACFAAIPANGASSSIHDIYFINDIANGCVAGGFVTAPTGKASVDYFLAIADIVYNAAQGNAYCYSGVSVLEPVATDNIPGTHIFVSQIFAWHNLEPSVCNNVNSTDGEGVIFDTFNGSQGGLSPYAQQSAIENVIAIYNGAYGILAGGGSGNSNSRMFVRNVTAYGNFINTNQNQNLCAQMSSFGWPTTNAANANRLTTFTNNLAVTLTGQLPGCGTYSPYAYYFGNIDATDSFSGNAGYSVSGNAIGYTGLTSGFAKGSNSTETNPMLANPIEPPPPSCSGAYSVIGCMAPLIANSKPIVPAFSSYGYQAPSTTAVTDPLFPQWLCNKRSLLDGLVTMGCSTQ